MINLLINYSSPLAGSIVRHLFTPLKSHFTASDFIYFIFHVFFYLKMKTKKKKNLARVFYRRDIYIFNIYIK